MRRLESVFWGVVLWGMSENENPNPADVEKSEDGIPTEEAPADESATEEIIIDVDDDIIKENIGIYTDGQSTVNCPIIP